MTWHHLANRIPWSASHKRDPPSLLSQGGVNHSEKCKVDKDNEIQSLGFYLVAYLKSLSMDDITVLDIQFVFWIRVFFWQDKPPRVHKQIAETIRPSIYQSRIRFPLSFLAPKNESWHIHRRSTLPRVESRMNNKSCAKKEDCTNMWLPGHSLWPFWLATGRLTNPVVFLRSISRFVPPELLGWKNHQPSHTVQGCCFFKWW